MLSYLHHPSDGSLLNKVGTWNLIVISIGHHLLSLLICSSLLFDQLNLLIYGVHVHESSKLTFCALYTSSKVSMLLFFVCVTMG